MWAALFVGVATAAAPQSGAAQWAYDPVIPGGRIRLGFAPSFSSWDSRYGRRTEDGTVVEETEPLAFDLQDPSGVSLFPGVVLLRDELRALLDRPEYAPLVGASTASVTQNVTRLDFSAEVGVFDWLTVGARVPWVKTRSAVDVSFAPSVAANVGLNPLIRSNAAVSAYLETAAGRVSGATSAADAACASAPSSAACGSARALADRLRAFVEGLRRAYLASPFFPLQGSVAAVVLQESLADLAADLAAAGLAGLASPTFATDTVDAELFAELPTDPGVGIQGSALTTRDPLWALGDVEVSLAARLLESGARSAGAEPRSGADPRSRAEPLAGTERESRWALSAGGLVRLGTGRVADADVYFDPGTGDGQTDVEGFLHAAWRRGARWEVRAVVRYGVQAASTVVRRVAAPDVVLAPASTRATVRRTPGAYAALLLSPRYRLSPALSVAADLHAYRQGGDTYEVAVAGEGLDPAILELETERSFRELGIGLRYDAIRAWSVGRDAPPMELGARVVLPLGGSGGLTPRATRGELTLSLLPRLWGGR